MQCIHSYFHAIFPVYVEKKDTHIGAGVASEIPRLVSALAWGRTDAATNRHSAQAEQNISSLRMLFLLFRASAPRQSRSVMHGNMATS